ncbi:MAG: methyl-accepting chemotaxis protein [Treponema sp.]|jgi:methyl-accepting chemotaxis protein|nr:methyl-accepting chemotaxis protein [Treponema sp.]
MFRDMKISARLIISSAVFLAPMGIMLVLIVTSAGGSIRLAEREQRGLACLRSIAGLLRSASGEPAEAPPEALLRALGEEYAAVVNASPAGRRGERGSREEQEGSLIEQIRGDFESLGRDEGEARLRIARNLRALSVRVGNDAALITGPDAAGYYLVDVAVRVFPQSWERITLIGDLLRRFQDSRSFSADDLKTASDLLALLALSDYPLALSDMEAALTLISEEGLLREGEIFPILASYRSALEWFISAARLALSLYQGEGASGGPPSAPLAAAYAKVPGARAAALENSYTLMNVSLDQLEVLLERRVNRYRGQFIRSLSIVILASVLAFAIVIMTAVYISRSAGKLRGLFRALANKDLSIKLTSQSRDEFGELMTAFNSFLEELRAAFDSFNREAAMVSSSVFDLSASAKEISTTANEQSASVAEILSTMEGSKNLSAQGAAKTQEVAELAAETQELSRRGADLRDANQDMMGMIRNQNGKIIDEINALADMLGRINESIAIIDSIADQTKLIAFNASLEAAASVDAMAAGNANGGYADGGHTDGSGDSARFSVVAAEIRRFAGNVADSTAEIKEQMEEVRQASQSLIEEANNGRLQIDQGYDRMVRQKEVFEKIVEVSQNVAVRSQQISNLSRQQEYASGQIFVALKEISAGVNQFVTATTSTSRIADNLNVMSVELRDVLAKYRTGETGQQ